MTRRGKLRAGLSAAVVLAAAATGCAGAGAAAGQGIAAGTPKSGASAPPAARYQVYVANESSDVVSRVVFAPGVGAEVAARTTVGIMPADIDGPHGLTVAPDGEHWYVSLAHGTPYGSVWKYAAATGELVGRVELGLFPATMALTPDGEFLFTVNFNLHGDPVPSSVSVVHAPGMVEVARPTTCVMPHGSRINAAGTKHYSVCMHSEQLVEIDTHSFEVTGRFSVAPGRETPLALDETGAHAGRAMHASASGAAVCSPTWAQPGVGARADRYVYVPCNKNAEILEVDVERWTVARRFPTGKAPYNLATTPDGKLLLATLKGEQALAVIDLETGEETARIPTTQPITHGVIVSPDGRYAFVTNEAIGSTHGTVDVIDLARLERVASTEVDHQPGGIDFWKSER